MTSFAPSSCGWMLGLRVLPTVGESIIIFVVAATERRITKNERFLAPYYYRTTPLPLCM